MERNYKLLKNDYKRLCEVSEDFRKDQNISVEFIIEKYYSHPESEVGLDIARDYMYGFPEYDIIIKDRPELQRSYASTKPPRQDAFEVTWGNYTK